MIIRFGQKRPELDRIRQMIDEDNLEGRIHADYADLQLSARGSDMNAFAFSHNR